MKLYKRRRLSVSLLAILLGVLSGCGPSSEDTGFTQSQLSAASAATFVPSPAEAATRISWTMHQNLPVPEDAEVLTYVEQKHGVQLDMWNLPNNKYEALLDLKLAQGSIPDLFRIRQPHDLLKYQSQGVLAPIPEDVLLKYAPNIMRALHTHAPRYLEHGMINGELYGIPVVSPTNRYRIPVVYREDWLHRLGLPVPQTLEELERVMYAFAHEDPDGNGVNDTYGISSEGMNVVFGSFGQIVFADQLYFGEKEGRLVVGALEPEMKEALAYLQRWYKDGVVDPEFITGENKGGYKHLSHSFINSRIGMTSMGNYYHWIQEGDYQVVSAVGEEAPVEAAYNALELKRKTETARIVFGPPVIGPQGKSGSKAYNLLMSFTAIGADAAAVPGKMEKILAVLDDVSANPDPTEYNTMKHGIQDKHWSWFGSSHKDMVILPPYDTTNDYTNLIGSNIGMTVPREPTDRREQWASTLSLEKNGIYNKMEVSTPALIKYGPELAKLRNKAYISIITGDQPVDYFDTFVQEFLDSGGELVLQEANDWYQRK